MHNSAWTSALVAILSLACAGTTSAQSADASKLEQVVVAGKQVAPSDWLRAESQRFVVYSDADQDDVTVLLENLEKLDYLLRQYTGARQGAGQPPQPKMTLYYYRNASALGEVAARVPADAVGLYSSCASGVQGFALHVERVPRLTDERLDRSPLDQTLSHVFEAYARHFLYRNTDIRLPTSFIDGFAWYFSTVRFSEGQMVVGRMPSLAAQYLKLQGDLPVASLEYADVLEENLSHAHSAAGPGGVRLEFEVKAWLLTHYMLSSPDNRQRLGRYLATLDEGASPTAALERAYGVKAGELGLLMRRYSVNSVKALRVAQPALPTARISFRVLPLGAGEFVLANAALKACPSRPEGEALLQKVAALAARFPGDEQARVTLSRAQIEWGEPADALPALNALLKDDDAHFEARYLLGLAHLRLAERNEGGASAAHLQAAQQHLRLAQALNPQSTEAALALFKAEVRATDQPLPQTLQAVIAAWQTAREVNPLAQSAALAHAWNGHADDAYRALDTLAHDPRNKGSAQWARHWQARLKQGVTRGAILAEMRRDAASDAPLKEWTVDQRDALQVLDLITKLEREVERSNWGEVPGNGMQASSDVPAGALRAQLYAAKARRKPDYRQPT